MYCSILQIKTIREPQNCGFLYMKNFPIIFIGQRQKKEYNLLDCQGTNLSVILKIMQRNGETNGF